jgi:hypothetical protein
VASYSRWQSIEQCPRCLRLIDTESEDHIVITTTIGRKRYWHRPCLDIVCGVVPAPPQLAA